MPLYWVMGRDAAGQQRYYLGESGAPIFAMLRAAIAGLDGTAHREWHELDRRTARKVPRKMIGRVLAQREAKALLRRLGG